MVPRGWLGAIVTGLVLLVAGAEARELTVAEQAGLEATIAGYNKAMAANDLKTLVEIIPPPVIETFAAQSKMPADKFREMLIGLMADAMASVELVSYSMTLDGAQHEQLADGTPYVLLPTETVMDTGDGNKLRASSSTLAFMDNGKWYLVRVSEAAQATMLKQVYPEFAAVEFPAGTLETVQ